MSGPTLCGVINKFPSRNDCAHFGDMCDGTGDEPGDTFEERRKYAIDGRFYDVSFESFATSDDLRDDDDESGEEGSTEDEIEFSGEYAHFCAMSFRQQAVYMATMRAKICVMIGVSSQTWEPSDAFILDAIQDETQNDVLKEMAYAAYLATPEPYEFNPSDVEPELPLDDDHIRVSQQGSSGKSDHPQDSDLGRSYRTRCKKSNSRKKKCWHSNRRETIRRNSELYFEKHVDAHYELAILEQDSEFVGEREFVTVQAQMRMCLDDDLTSEQLEWLDDINLDGYDYEPKAFNFRFRRPSPDWFDDFAFDFGNDCTCPACMRGWDGYSSRENDDFRDAQDLVERFGDRYDGQGDIFEGFGETDADIDRIFPRFSSSGRFSYRFYGLSRRQQEALQR